MRFCFSLSERALRAVAIAVMCSEAYIHDVKEKVQRLTAHRAWHWLARSAVLREASWTRTRKWIWVVLGVSKHAGSSIGSMFQLKVAVPLVRAAMAIALTKFTPQ